MGTVKPVVINIVVVTTYENIMTKLSHVLDTDLDCP